MFFVAENMCWDWLIHRVAVDTAPNATSIKLVMVLCATVYMRAPCVVAFLPLQLLETLVTAIFLIDCEWRTCLFRPAFNCAGDYPVPFVSYKRFASSDGSCVMMKWNVMHQCCDFHLMGTYYLLQCSLVNFNRYSVEDRHLSSKNFFVEINYPLSPVWGVHMLLE